MNKFNKFDDYEGDKYKQRKGPKMKTLRDDDQYGSMFTNHNKLKNLDTTMFDDDEYDDEYEEYEE
jgi:hypothetical protein